ncbi:hypothetical protein KY495_09835 [Massilia sp. PAMC28688]|uniref:hypothetical protein n=1 Tax=Massilia sp. PAMC28688 TaxID=2861283 RepID=UPI001C63668F|nr:hypothetical protein [Massilia sp. PAMC28688]QYF95419.1 hypothetical protein KY495_09835 [Massilia sp. PAMC28688]
MTKYNKDYGFLTKNNDVEGYPTLKPDTNTADRRYQHKPLARGSAPLIFSNGHAEHFAKNGIQEKEASVLFDGATFIVGDHIRMALLPLELPTINIHPAVYVDATGQWHEDYWYVAFDDHISCVDRAKSHFMPADENDDDLTMVKYSLDEKVLDAIPLQERLLFRIGGTDTGMVVCHHSLFKLFKGDGLKITMIDDY